MKNFSSTRSKILLGIILLFLISIVGLLAWLYSSGKLSGSAATIRTSRKVYAYSIAADYNLGNTVTFALKNIGSTTVALSNGAPWSISNSAGQNVYNPRFTTSTIVYIAPGTEKRWTWNQKDNQGVQVPIGSYRVYFKDFNVSATFNIKQPIVLFSDDFSSASLNLSKWEEVYNGYGIVKIDSGNLNMIPMTSTEHCKPFPAYCETHAPLVVSIPSWTNYTFEVRGNTVRQLRQNYPPNFWEVGWLLFRYQKAGSYYYFAHKTNGIELGKVVNEVQKFLVTAPTPQLNFGQWYSYKVVLNNDNIKVYIENELVANYTDVETPTNHPYLNGKIGLYNEDAETRHDDVKVTAN